MFFSFATSISWLEDDETGFSVTSNGGIPMKIISAVLLCSSLFLSYSSVWADSDEDEMARMQKQLNQNVMQQPFLAEQPEKVDAYIKEAMKKKLKPPEYTGPHWRNGYTCHDMLRYSWYEYRNCRYYYRYYGHYYPYP
jgi:hypothetical protein